LEPWGFVYFLLISLNNAIQTTQGV
jgi:hypothetical protein